MFIKAIETVGEFTRGIHTIMREYNSTEVIPGASTLFFVNENGCAVTCKHVAQLLAQADPINNTYQKYKDEIGQLVKDAEYDQKLKETETRYSYKASSTIQLKNNFVGCIDQFSNIEIKFHPIYDLAIVQFIGYQNLGYKGFAKFIKDSSMVKPGKYLCRLGYPFPEFSNFTYNPATDDIEWTQEGVSGTPRFPIDGIMTRDIIANGQVCAIEMSTPGLKGQSGGPLFDQEGFIFGMQSMTHHKHLGFDIVDYEINKGSQKKVVSNFPFLHLGICIHVDIIKAFLKQHGVKYYESDDQAIV